MKRGYQIVPFPRSRQLVIDSARMGHRKHIIRGLVEFDVTHPRQLIQEYKEQTGEALSFTAFLIACLGRSVDENKHVHAYRDWRGRLILFEEVDVSTLIEVELEGRKFPLPHILRAVNQRALLDIHQEIRTVKAKPQTSPRTKQMAAGKYFLMLPAVIRDIFFRLLGRSPHLWKQNAGTVALTAVGMFGSGGGWGLSLPNHTLNVVVGGIAEKPGVVAGKIMVRQYLSVTVDFDHDLVDGAPAARFAQRFKELVESSFGLVDLSGSGFLT